MTADELRTIVARVDGTKALAARLKVTGGSSSLGWRGSGGSGRIRPRVEDRIRDLEQTDNPTLRP